MSGNYWTLSIKQLTDLKISLIHRVRSVSNAPNAERYPSLWSPATENASEVAVPQQTVHSQCRCPDQITDDVAYPTQLESQPEIRLCQEAEGRQKGGRRRKLLQSFALGKELPRPLEWSSGLESSPEGFWTHAPPSDVWVKGGELQINDYIWLINCLFFNLNCRSHWWSCPKWARWISLKWAFSNCTSWIRWSASAIYSTIPKIVLSNCFI